MNKTSRARVALVGLGPIGIEVGKALLDRPYLELLGAADPATQIAGKPLSQILGTGPSTAVDASAKGLYSRSKAGRHKQDVAVLCTGSRLESVMPQIQEAVEAGLHVVSTCEELAYPQLKHAVLGHRIDELAKKHGVGVLGTGVNPGLVMDRLALAAAAACVRVDRVKVTRIVDAAKRRGPLRAKVGAGLTRDEFMKGVEVKKLGHVGLSESAAIIAQGLGLPIEEITETIEPVVAKKETDGVAPGNVLGLHQIALVQAGDEARVVLDLTMAVGVSDPSDTIDIEGDPPVHMRVSGGFHGDRATVGCVVNAIPFIVGAQPGLHTVVTLPLFGLFPEA
ncbi:MAG TPA: dihydrodipicolinate reductase [Thermoanaerobaculia bacterium]|nr:dihydrodipicolinate reductase [Thermoanaerobaculia bacterium]